MKRRDRSVITVIFTGPIFFELISPVTILSVCN